jgi:hypothetical protein
VAARVTALTADAAKGARPRFVWRITPVALITEVSPKAAFAARPIARARISSSDGGSAPAAAAERISSREVVRVRFRTERPTVAEARCPGSERRRASTEGTFLRASPVVRATFAAYPVGRTATPWAERRPRG